MILFGEITFKFFVPNDMTDIEMDTASETLEEVRIQLKSILLGGINKEYVTARKLFTIGLVE